MHTSMDFFQMLIEKLLIKAINVKYDSPTTPATHTVQLSPVFLQPIQLQAVCLSALNPPVLDLLLSSVH